MVQKKIYFVENLHGIQYFLSLYQPDDTNLIVISKEAKSSNMFLQEIMPDEEKLIVPRIPLRYFVSKWQFEAQNAQIVAWCNRYGHLLSHIQPPATAYFFGTNGSIHFFILLNQLQDKGIEIKYVNAHPDFLHDPVPDHCLDIQYRRHLKDLSKLLGFRVIAEKCRAWIDIALADYPRPLDYTPDSWQILCEKYSWSFKRVSEDAVLLIDGPIQAYKGIVFEKSQRILVAFLRKLMDRGMKIHLKPHYDERRDSTSLSGTYLEKKVRILPKYFPVELIMHQYPVIYGYSSTSLATPIKGKKYSLANLLKFNSTDAERVFWEIFNDVYAGRVKTKQLNNGLIELFDKEKNKTVDLKQAGQTKSLTSVGEKEAKVTILIPTLNRSEFMLRALSYYGKVGFKGWICIGDSSDAQHSNRIKSVVFALEDKLNIIYKYFPKLSYDLQTCFKELIEIAPTPYLVYSGDDDLLIPASLDQCTAFLEDHPEYSAAHGLRIAYSLKGGGEFGKIEHIHYVQQHTWESEKASERWDGYVRNAISTQYYVHRKETWRRMYRDIGSVPTWYLGPEFLPCSLTAVSGKVKQLECLATLFQMQDNRPFSWDNISIYDLTVEQDWSKSVQGLKRSIVEALMQQDGVNEKIAQEIFDKKFWYLLKSFFVWQYQKKYGELKPGEMPFFFNLEDSCKSIYAIITNPTWSDSISRTRANYIKTIAKDNGIDDEKASRVFDRGLWFYLLVHLNKQYQEKYGVENPTMQMDGDQKIIRDYGKLLSLKDLLNRNSLFHKDFMPAYQIVTGQVEYALEVQTKTNVALSGVYDNIKSIGYARRIINKDGRLTEKVSVLNKQGEDFFNKGDIAGALTAFTKAVEIDPSFGLAYNNLGVLYWQTGGAQKAVECFAKAIEIDPNDQNAILNYDEVLKSTKQSKDVKELYSSYLQKNSDIDWEDLRHLHSVRLYAGDLPEKKEYDGLIGLSLSQSDHRHIKYDITNSLPLSNNSVSSYQAEDVFEHIEYDKLLPIINEIYRVLKPNGTFRLSIPDYGCDVLINRSIKDASGDIVFDPGGGGTPQNPGHVWFPHIDKVKQLLEKSDFGKLGKIECLHYYNMDGTFVADKIDYSKGHIQRTPDFDKRVQNPYRPMSIVVDLYKSIKSIETVEIKKDAKPWQRTRNIVAYPHGWQYPAITEQHAYERVCEDFPDFSDVMYIGFPWATLIDLLHANKRDKAQQYLDRLQQIPAHNAAVKITVAQHILAGSHIELFKHIGITDLFWTHASRDTDNIDGIRIHPFPLYPVQCLKNENIKTKPLRKRKYLYSFVGAYDSRYYLSKSRDWISKLPQTDYGLTRVTKEWHFNSAVYEKQILSHVVAPEKQAQLDSNAEEYRQLLSDTIFSLCPSGSGPNSIRLWESLGFGCIPVIIADTLKLPGELREWEQAAVFVREEEATISALPITLKHLAENFDRLQCAVEAGQELWKKYGHENFIHGILKFSKSCIRDRSINTNQTEGYLVSAIVSAYNSEGQRTEAGWQGKSQKIALQNTADTASPEKLYQTAQGLISSGMGKEAIGALGVFLSIYPDYALAHNDLGVLYYNAGDKEQALDQYEQAAQLEPENIIFQKNLADFYFVEAGRIEEALQIYVKLLEADPTDIEILLILGQICESLKKVDDAIVFYNRALEIDWSNAYAIERLQAMQKV